MTRIILNKGRPGPGPFLCRFCGTNLDAGDAYEYFQKEAQRCNRSIEWGIAQAKLWEWTKDNLYHAIRYYNPYPDYSTRWSLQYGEDFMTDEICPECFGIFPLSSDEKRLFWIQGKVTPFRYGGRIIERGATFSEDGRYRYELHRIWDDDLDKVLFILLNPSKADNDKDDHTTRRCIHLAQQQGFGGMYIANLYAHLSEEPRKLKEIDDAEDPIGPSNERTIRELIGKVTKVVYAWGEKIKHVSPVNEPGWLKRLVPQPYCFKKTNHGYPYHPRNIENDTPFIKFREEDEEDTWHELVPYPPLPQRYL